MRRSPAPIFSSTRTTSELSISTLSEEYWTADALWPTSITQPVRASAGTSSRYLALIRFSWRVYASSARVVPWVARRVLGVSIHTTAGAVLHTSTVPRLHREAVNAALVADVSDPGPDRRCPGFRRVGGRCRRNRQGAVLRVPGCLADRVPHPRPHRIAERGDRPGCPRGPKAGPWGHSGQSPAGPWDTQVSPRRGLGTPKSAPWSIASPLQWIDACFEVEVKLDCRVGSECGGTPVGAGLADGHRSGGGGSQRIDSGAEDARVEGAAHTGVHLRVCHEGGRVPREGPELLLQPRTGFDHCRRDQRGKDRRRGDRRGQSV